MAPGPKKRNFHTPRNTKNTQASKGTDKKSVESQDEVIKTVDTNSNSPTDSDISQKDKYSKRGVESNWVKYEEPQVDPHADTTRGNDFNVLLSYSGGSGSQLKLQDEKEWDDEFTNDLSLDIQDLVCVMKCIPFHERIALKNVFDDKTIMNFVSVAKNNEMSYKPLSKSEIAENKAVKEIHEEPVLDIMEEQGLIESDDDSLPIKTITVQDKTEDIINSLASNLSFKTFSEKVVEEKLPESPVTENKNQESASNDLDFLLSLNISSKIPAKEESSSVAKSTNVDDWLNSLLDD